MTILGYLRSRIYVSRKKKARRNDTAGSNKIDTHSSLRLKQIANSQWSRLPKPEEKCVTAGGDLAVMDNKKKKACVWRTSEYSEAKVGI